MDPAFSKGATAALAWRPIAAAWIDGTGAIELSPLELCPSDRVELLKRVFGVDGWEW